MGQAFKQELEDFCKESEQMCERTKWDKELPEQMQLEQAEIRHTD